MTFRINVLLRVVFLMGLGYTAVFIWTQTHFWLVSFWLALAAFLLTLDLIRYVEKSDRELVFFLDAIRQNDFSNSYSTPRSHTQNERVRRAFLDLMRVLQRLSQEKEANHLYLQTVVEHVSVALLCFNTQGRVALLNTTAKHLLGKPFLHDLPSLRAIDPALYEAVRSLRPGQPALVKYLHQGSRLTLSLHCTHFRLKDQNYTLVSFRDIRPELEQQEAESWQKLIRVLTHEIMNSVIPITNLSEVVNEMLAEKTNGQPQPAVFAPEEVADLQGSLQTIGRRSKGLAQFVKAYGQLTRLPPPNLQEVPADEMVERVCRLLRPGLEKRGIQLHLSPLPAPARRLNVDPEQIEQVLINLVLNAADAVAGTSFPTVFLLCTSGARGQMLLEVRDNGPGIPPENLEQIFVPFYTTKPRGTGIGLSLSRQIMRQHNGSLQVQSEVGKETVFTLTFF